MMFVLQIQSGSDSEIKCDYYKATEITCKSPDFTVGNLNRCGDHSVIHSVEGQTPVSTPGPGCASRGSSALPLRLPDWSFERPSRNKGFRILSPLLKKPKTKKTKVLKCSIIMRHKLVKVIGFISLHVWWPLQLKCCSFMPN